LGIKMIIHDGRMVMFDCMLTIYKLHRRDKDADSSSVNRLT